MNNDVLIASSPLAWIVLGKFQNENQKELEFNNHRFMIDIYSDNSPDIVCRKSAQVGFSVFAILKSFHELKYEKRNILYALPTKNVVQDFVVPKVNPLIVSNPAIAKDMGSDSVSLKKLGDRFIYFKGGSEREAISVSADTLVIDEFDRMPNMNVVTMFDSRLQAAAEPRRRRFSNPSSIGFGVDMLYNDSKAFHWFITCHSCKHEWFIDYSNEDGKNHYVDKESGQYVCGICHKAISDADRRNGRWVAKYPSRHRNGYWISQLMAPWVSAARIIEQETDMTVDVFHNMVLGKAYTPSDLIVNRETILRACAPSIIPKLHVAMGVDQKAAEQEWVAATPQGVFAHGRTKSWEEIEQLKLMWNAIVVADPNPYSIKPKQLAAKYNDFYLCYFKDMKDQSLLQWKYDQSVVYADRTRLLDTVANEITEARLLFREHPMQLEDYIADWQNIYRTTEELPDGRIKSVWMKKENKESDFSFATAYMRIALSRIVEGGESTVLEPQLPIPDNVTYTATMHNGQTAVETDFGSIVEDTFNEMEV